MTVKCLSEENKAIPQPGYETGPLDPVSSALTIRPPCTYSHTHIQALIYVYMSKLQQEHSYSQTVLTVQSKVLGKGLSCYQFKSFTDKVAYSPCIHIWITSHKTLISNVYQREQLSPLENKIIKYTIAVSTKLI